MSPGEQLPTGSNNPDLRPPGSPLQAETSQPARHGLIWGALAVVVVLVLLVLLVLPKLVPDTPGERVAQSPDQEIIEPEPSRAGKPEASTSSRAEAEKALQDFLQLRARLELANAPVWGEPEWSRALDGAARANDMFAQRQFAAAGETLAESLALLQSLESGRDGRLAAALDAGWQALQEDDSESAAGFFETAVAIEADNVSALEGLERARVRPAVLKLMAEGEDARNDGELQVARQAFQEAAELDMAYEPASAALLEVTEQITELAFNDAMSRALVAMEAHQIGVAEQALAEADRLKPNEDVVGDTRYQLKQLEQDIWLDGQRQDAARLEKDEDWSGAVRIYREVLARVPQAAFASDKLALAQDRERLHAQLDHYLSDPTRVWSDKPRENAEKLLVAAGKAPVTEPVLAEKISLLKAIIVEAQTPQVVVLQSDGLTNVSIYHVGRLGQFTSQQLELRPGTYTVVGSRPGYRDVRQTLTVKPGSGQNTLVILCEEPV